MTTIALSGNDTIILNNRILTDFGAGNVAELTLPNDIASVKVGKNGNSIYGLNYSGLVCDLKLIIIRGSADDRFLNDALTQQNLDFASTVLLVGQLIKYIGNGKGKVVNDVYSLGGGIFTKQVHARTNTDGEAEQSQAEYLMRFSNHGDSVRTLV